MWDSTPEAADVSGSLGVQVLEDDIETTWVSKDGTSIEYRDIKPGDFWDPEGKPLFG